MKGGGGSTDPRGFDGAPVENLWSDLRPVSEAGQGLAQTTGCLDVLLDLYRSEPPSSFGESVHR